MGHSPGIVAISKRTSSFVSRLSTMAMTLPFLVTLVLAMKDSQRHTFSLSGKIGLAVAIFSLGLAWNPVSDGLTRSKQVKNLAMRDDRTVFR
jgi:hypothetical protein